MCHEAWTGGHHSLKVKMQQCQPPIPVSQVQYPLQVWYCDLMFLLILLFIAASFIDICWMRSRRQPKASASDRRARQSNKSVRFVLTRGTGLAPPPPPPLAKPCFSPLVLHDQFGSCLLNEAAF